MTPYRLIADEFIRVIQKRRNFQDRVCRFEVSFQHPLAHAKG